MKQYEKISTELLQNTEKLKRLILDNPELPLLVFAGENAVAGDWFYWMNCSSVTCEIGEFLDCNQKIDPERLFTDRREFEDELIDDIWYMDESGEDFELRLEKEKRNYEPYWKPCILLYVDN